MEKRYRNMDCPVSFCMQMIGGKWKPVIIFLIRKGCNRFGKLQKAIDGISKQMLTKQLRELEEDGILNRKIYPEIPPRVEYSISEFGQSLFPIIDQMSEWGLTHMPKETREAAS
ncbi:MAG: helix-turn-helix domain-containing protein [Bacteroidota bacterium]